LKGRGEVSNEKRMKETREGRTENASSVEDVDGGLFLATLELVVLELDERIAVDAGVLGTPTGVGHGCVGEEEKSQFDVKEVGKRKEDEPATFSPTLTLPELLCCPTLTTVP
jgi:hypothetical protein